MSVNPTVLFRVEAGVGVGLGHLQRCLALAEALAERGARPAFLLPPSEDARGRLSAAGFPGSDLSAVSGSQEDAADVVARAHAINAAIVIVDSYTVGAAYLDVLRTSGMRVVVLDDLARETLPAHVVINGGAQARSMAYRSSTGDTRFLLGPEFALLARDVVPRTVRPIAQVEQVLVTVGGDDPHDALVPCIEAVAAVGALHITAVVGPFSHRGAAVHAVAERSPVPVTVIEGARGLRALIAETDIAVSAGGQTLYELAVAGTPTIAVPLFDNQRGSVDALVAAGAVVAVDGFGTPGFRARLTHAVASLCADLPARERLRAAARALVDGLGAGRAADVVLEGA